MSEKNKTKIEKKLVASIALIITIGIATVIPLTLLMGNTVRAQTNIGDSLFTLDIPCAYYNADVTYNVEMTDIRGDNHRVLDYYYRDAAVIAVQPSINISALSSDTVARIELFEYTVYTDTLELQKSYNALTFNAKAFAPYETENSHGHRDEFAMQYWLENLESKLDSSSKSFFSLGVTTPDEPIISYSVGAIENFGDVTTDRPIDEKHSNILAEVEKSQLVYVDIRRVAYISLEADGTLIIVEDNKLLHHLELTKTDDGFMYGNPADANREFYYGLPKIPYNGTTVPEEFWPIIWPDLFGE